MVEPVYSDKNASKKILDSILEHDCLPKGMIATMGYITGMKSNGNGQSCHLYNCYDSLERAGTSISACSMLLLSKPNRKASDTLQTLDGLLAESTEILLTHDEFMPGYKTFSKTVDGLARIINTLSTGIAYKPDITIKELADTNKDFNSIHQSAYDALAPNIKAQVKHMFKEFPKYKGKIKEERVFELLMNIPVVTLSQLRTGLTPSDFVKPDEQT